MARTSFVDIEAGYEVLYYGVIKSGDRFVFSKMARNIVLLSRLRKTGVSQRSLLPQISALWAVLSDAEKLAWKNAGLECQKTQWRLFVKDSCLRIINGLSVPGVPSLFHQGTVGKLHIGGAATGLEIIQMHPRSYYINHKVVGFKNMYEPLLVTEDFALPLTLSLNYYADCFPQAGVPDAKFYAKVWSSYQGVDRFTLLEIPLCFTTFFYYGTGSYGLSEYGFDADAGEGWISAEATLSSVIGHIIAYDLFVKLENLQGDLYFDNIKAEHSSQNWCRDTYCEDINRAFTRAFYQIPKHWAAIDVPSGTYFESVYKDF